MFFKGKKNSYRNFIIKLMIGDVYGCLKKIVLFCENWYNIILFFFF